VPVNLLEKFSSHRKTKEQKTEQEKSKKEKDHHQEEVFSSKREP
jgi:hypothetical protein